MKVLPKSASLLHAFKSSSIIHFSIAQYSTDFSHLPGARQPKKPQKSTSRRLLEISHEQVVSSFKHSVDLVRQHDFDNYIGGLFSPKAAQPGIFAVLAFNVELAQIREKVGADSKSTTGIYRLQFWKDTLESIFNKRVGPVPRQPIAIALCSFASTSPFLLWESIVTARQQTIGDRQFKTVDEACKYGLSTWGSVIKLWMNSLATISPNASSLIDHPQAIQAAEHVATAFSMANMVRSALPLLSRGIVLLPADLCSIHGVTPDRLYNKKQENESKGVIRDLINIASDELLKARSLKAAVPKELRPALLSFVASCEYIIRTTKKADYLLFDKKLQRRNALLPWTLLWRRARDSY
ncbi:unnamed protein product, partial [Mesorhabditis belari]|uniref:NADH dehydrogenase (Ubiquinone) complex I, assembly factor 6 n=1 Tax=Mesorhabditis belari TaxID=2138241 RepID=A0AAF3ENK3_9BILA